MIVEGGSCKVPRWCERRRQNFPTKCVPCFLFNFTFVPNTSSPLPSHHYQPHQLATRKSCSHRQILLTATAVPLLLIYVTNMNSLTSHCEVSFLPSSTLPLIYRLRLVYPLDSLAPFFFSSQSPSLAPVPQDYKDLPQARLCSSQIDPSAPRKRQARAVSSASSTPSKHTGYTLATRDGTLFSTTLKRMHPRTSRTVDLLPTRPSKTSPR